MWFNLIRCQIESLNTFYDVKPLLIFVDSVVHGQLSWDEDGFKIVGNRKAQLGWWGQVVGLSRGDSGAGVRRNLVIEMGDGASILFWHHVWVGESSLKSVFPRLFRLSSKQGGTVKDMGLWVQGSWVWEMEWRRGLLEREERQVQSLLTLLYSVSMVAGAVDVWRWKAASDGVYSTNSAYNSFSQSRQNTLVLNTDEAMVGIWKAPTPIKARYTGWRILKDRMATCENLKKRQVVIDAEEDKCVACRSNAETSVHFFFSCPESIGIWKKVLKWIGVQSALAQKAKDHLLHSRIWDRRQISGSLQAFGVQLFGVFGNGVMRSNLTT